MPSIGPWRWNYKQPDEKNVCLEESGKHGLGPETISRQDSSCAVDSTRPP